MNKWIVETIQKTYVTDFLEISNIEYLNKIVDLSINSG